MRWPATLFTFTICAVAMALPTARAAGVAEREVRIEGAGGTSLAGTLLLPAGAHRPPFPALVLIAGSGPTDRNGNQPPLLTTDLLKQVAEHLARRGVASIRFDKRGMHANADQLPKDPARHEEFFAWENFVGDAVAAYGFLRERPEVDPSRVGILGHSEGGLVSLAASHLLRREDQTPATLILLSTPGRPLREVIEDQLRATLKRQGATAEQTRFFLDANARITKAIQETGRVPGDVPAGLAALYPPYLGKFLRSVHNRARGGDGGTAGDGGSGFGGGVYNGAASTYPSNLNAPTVLEVSRSAIVRNEAGGGAGGTDGNGGQGLGGGLYDDASPVTVRRSVLVANRAQGGAAGSGGASGQGIGGGIYVVPGGTVCVDALTLILANDASTSDDNVFGELCFL